MDGKTISLRVGNMKHLIWNIKLMFPHQAQVLQHLIWIPTGCNLVFHPEGWISTITIKNMTNYLIKRKWGDDERNKDYKNLDSKAFGLFNHGHVQNIKVELV